jgi:SAM-dependent methyltransferase
MRTLYDDPELYDALLTASEAQVSFYVALALRQAGDVLALACGSGQIIVPIASRGVPATGLDHSSAMHFAGGPFMSESMSQVCECLVA